MDFKQFLEEYQKLTPQYPTIPTHSLKSEDSDFGDYLYSCKNCYLSFDNASCQDCLYVFDSFKAVNCADCDCVQLSERLYECVDAFKCYNSAYLNFCSRMYDSFFCWDCTDCHDIFGCTHLKHKQYCIFNRQFSKEDYQKKVAELLKRPAEENLKELEKLIERYPVTQTNVTHSENCDYGNHVHNSKNLYLCFDTVYSEDSGYLYDSQYCKNSFDLTYCHKCELTYQANDSARLYNCHHMDYCSDIYDSGFCFNCYGSDHLFGCVSLTRKKYQFLNKPYPEEEWEKLVEEVMVSFRQSAR